MIRTFSAISIVALSGALAGPSASAQVPTQDSLTKTKDFNASKMRERVFDGEATTVEVELDAGVVMRDSAFSGDASTLFDIQAGFEFEAISESGHRWGFDASVRAERDSGRTAWGGRVGDCPPITADCATVLNGVLSHPVRSYASGYYSAGSVSDDQTQIAIATAYLFSHTGWGEWRVGYGPGAADLDIVSGPTAFRLVRADGGRVDLTGLSGARTRHLTSGVSPKILFQSIALGQASTIGTVQVSASFTPQARDCGVDVCLEEYGAAGLLTPLADSVWELAARYEMRRGAHTFAISGGVSHGEEATGRAGFSDIVARDLGLSWASGAWSAGARWFRSNNAVTQDGEYEAWSASAGFEAGPWLSVIEYAGFSDDLIHVDGRTVQVSASRLIGGHWVLGGGVQNSIRQDPVVTATGRQGFELDHTSIFAEVGWRF
jgi:hypothetical protein